MHFSAAILAGGYSSRFGTDKARFIYQNKALLTWVLESLKNAQEHFIIANRAYPDFDLHVYPDIIVQHGPLSGIHAALSHAQHDWVAIAACDMPFLTPEYWQALLKLAKQEQVVMVKSKQGLEPLAALYHRSSLAVIEQQLQNHQKAVHKLFDQLNARIIPLEDLAFDAKVLANINTLTDIS